MRFFSYLYIINKKIEIMKEDYRIDQGDPDLKVLAKELTKQGIRFRPEEYYEEGKGFIKTDIPELREASVRNLEKYGDVSREGNYIKTPFTYGWTNDDVVKLEKALLDASNRSEKTYFELHDVSDQEWTPDRIYEASFTFFSLHKAS
jgi:hypothetical protein